MMRLGTIWLLIFVSTHFALSQETVPSHEPHRLVIKLSTSNNNRTDGNILEIGNPPSNLGIISVEGLQSKLGTSLRATESEYLRGIHFLQLASDVDIFSTINKIKKYSNVIYAEPIYEVSLLNLPNDPAAQPESGQQTYLGAVNAHKAWEIFSGTSNMTIASIDTGLQLDHEDLQSNIAINTNDPINGIDDDNNGLVDDNRGWDFADSDNNPTADSNGHGTRVAGLHSAVGNNGRGMAGIAFNSKILPLKIFKSSNGSGFQAYQAIIHAADMGVQVMNLSWGAPNARSQFNQDVINYAALEKDVVIVAAAGNINAEIDYYPASYDNVLSVASSDLAGAKAGYATYSYYVDLLTPGIQLYSTANGNRYTSEGGSSFASPIVAGAAALVREKFPQYTARQVIEHMRATAKKVADLEANQPYEGQIGSGLLDVFSAINTTDTKSVRLTHLKAKGRFGNNIIPGDTISLLGTIDNVLSSLQSLNVSISTESPDITILSREINIPLMASGAVQEIKAEEFRFYIKKSETSYSPIIIKITITAADGYLDTQYFKVKVNDQYFDVAGGETEVSIFNNGSIGYATDGSNGGNGYRWKNEILGSNLGIMIGSSPATLADNFVNNFSNGSRNNDFKSEESLYVATSLGGDAYLETFYKDTLSGQGLSIEQKTIGWPNIDAVVFEYTIGTSTTNTYQNLHFGSYADFDIGDFNKTGYEEKNQIGYTFDPKSGRYSGISFISNEKPTFSGINIQSLNGNNADVVGSFSKELKYTYLIGAISKFEAGSSNEGNDVAQILGLRINNVSRTAPQKVSFVMSSAVSLASLIENMKLAKTKYNEFSLQPATVFQDTVCVGTSKSVNIPSGTLFDYFSDPRGAIKLGSGEVFVTPALYNDTIFFVQNLDKGYPRTIKSIRLKVKDHFDSIVATPPNLSITKPKTATFESASPESVTWEWYVNNEKFATSKIAIKEFAKEGVYLVELKSKDKYGCISTSKIEYTVVKVLGTSAQEAGINVYPIPVTDRLILDSKQKIREVSIIDIKGNLALSSKSLNQSIKQIDVSKLSPGVYIVQILLGDNTLATQKIVK